MKKDSAPFTGYNSQLTGRAGMLRYKMTKQERRLWFDYLQSYPLKWYRQRPIDRFIVDFYCSKAKLVIELDGSQHMNEDDREYDRQRTAVLSRYSLEVIRFSNMDVDNNFSGVCDAIDKKVKERLAED